MTIEEKRQAIEAHCKGRDCEDCKLYRIVSLEEECTAAENAECNYAILFGGSEDSYTTSTTREHILNTAIKMVCGHREQDYGKPEDSFAIIADLWTAYLGLHGTPISPVDVAMMMALLKIARIKGGTGTEDSFVDLAGYAACGGEIAGCMG